MDNLTDLTDLKFLLDIDWQAPWFAHLNALILTTDYQQQYQKYPSIAQICNALLTQSKQPEKLQSKNSPYFETINANYQTTFITGRQKPLHFVPQSHLPDGTAYETFIAETGGVPTRDNLHDWFNANMWLTLPKTKALLNRHQAHHIDQDGVTHVRGGVRDALTIFDENGAILVTSEPSIGKALKNFDWQNCLITPRADWDNSQQVYQTQQANPSAKASVYIFGHALLEQLQNPRKPLCSHTFIIYVDTEFFTLPMTQRMPYLDNILATQMDAWLQSDNISPRDLSPLPILGVPYFWADNANVEFYQDTFVFRAGRRKTNLNHSHKTR